MPGDFNRRETLALGLASTFGSFGTGIANAASTMPPLIEDVREFARLGPHRTGSEGNLRTLDWIERRLFGLGFEVERQPVRYPDHDLREAFVEVGGTRIEGIAQRPVCLTGGAGLSAGLALADDHAGISDVRGRIAVVRLRAARHSSLLEARTARPIKTALAAGCAGLLLVTDGPSGQAIALNAPLRHPVASIPTMVIAPRDAGPVVAAALRGEVARMVVDGERADAVSANLVARRRGEGRSIVVTTPLSGWFACAGERGSGVAAFLRLADLLSRRYPTADLRFAGFVGHEREYVGGDLFMVERAPSRDQVRLWIHIGAGFATRDWHEIADTQLMPLPSPDPQRYLLAPAAWLDTVRPAVKGLPGYEVPYPATVENASGEAGHIMARGYLNMITTIGAHRFHHTRGDEVATVDGAVLEQSWAGWSRAVLAVLEAHAAR